MSLCYHPQLSQNQGRVYLLDHLSIFLDLIQAKPLACALWKDIGQLTDDIKAGSTSETLATVHLLSSAKVWSLEACLFFSRSRGFKAFACLSESVL